MRQLSFWNSKRTIWVISDSDQDMAEKTDKSPLKKGQQRCICGRIYGQYDTHRTCRTCRDESGRQCDKTNLCDVCTLWSTAVWAKEGKSVIDKANKENQKLARQAKAKVARDKTPPQIFQKILLERKILQDR